MPSYIIKCRNCGHGSDIRGCPQSPMVIEGISICVCFVQKLKKKSLEITNFHFQVNQIIAAYPIM